MPRDQPDLRIDLHTHSRASDGSGSPAQVVRDAAQAGLDVVALTDHDTVDGHHEAAEQARASGIVFMAGAELSSADGDIDLHLLAYLFDTADPVLANELQLLRTDRVRRARVMVEKLRELGAPVTWHQVADIAGDADSVGRPHVAQALVDAGVVPDIAAAFTAEWIGEGGRAHVRKYSLEPIRAIELVHAAGGVVVFAHPAAAKRGHVVSEARIAEFAAAGLDGLEVDHPDHDPAARARLRTLAQRLGLLVTGSSDYHGSVKQTPIGAETTDPAMWRALVARATGGNLVGSVRERAARQ